MAHDHTPMMLTLALTAVVAMGPHVARAGTSDAPEVVRSVCAGCHGADGNGGNPTSAEFPKLAGKQSAYLRKQLKDYQTGKRKSPVMAPLAAALSPEQIEAVSAHYAEQTSRPATVTQSALLATGKKVYVDGNVESGVPACAGCHLPDASGNMRYPHLAGQHAPYTYAELRKFASGERDNDRGLVMQAVAARMTDEEMKAVSEYLAGLE
ncbi:cytochrome C [Sulfurifustis variabilis]|uniref:Cytochrome C n=1 Tax=Sulfurifustis variabilis TaxID=1675686 RepID=A0A1B4VA80_9GAMM|nr:c-type cytochrome [Sulfurifustis variabilis]BAU46731.1 cytochrome C [Sulfurifustis variabilis]